jgi:hypothetical protein
MYTYSGHGVVLMSSRTFLSGSSTFLPSAPPDGVDQEGQAAVGVAADVVVAPAVVTPALAVDTAVAVVVVTEHPVAVLAMAAATVAEPVVSPPLLLPLLPAGGRCASRRPHRIPFVSAPRFLLPLQLLGLTSPLWLDHLTIHL